MNANPVGSASALADRLLEWRPPSVRRRLPARELRAELAMALAFAIVTAALAVVLPSDGAVDPGFFLTLAVAYALVGRVMFQFGPGFVRPTQLVFVPMLFLLPAGAVAPAVAAGTVLCAVPELLRRPAGIERLPVAAADSWYSVGPALVVGLGGALEPWLLVPLALGAQFATDFTASTLRE